MSSIELLDKTRKINKLLHNNKTRKLVFNDICNVMSDIFNSSDFNQDISGWKIKPKCKVNDMFKNCKIKSKFMPEGTN